MFSAFTAILFLFVQTAPADSQEAHFETSLLSVIRAVSRGEAKKALLFYETRAVRSEELAKSGESPGENWEAASRSYREAAASANYLGNFQKAIDYGERALALAEKLENPRLKATAISTLVGAHRRARNFDKMSALIELGFQAAEAWPRNSPTWIWWQGVFHLHRGRDFSRRGEYEKAARDFEEVIGFEKEFLTRTSELHQRVADRREHARTMMLLGYGALGRTYLTMGKLDEALNTFQSGLDRATESNRLVRCWPRRALGGPILLDGWARTGA
jgi:tetratricopeptide (TPR) repeat protein